VQDTYHAMSSLRGPAKAPSNAQIRGNVGKAGLPHAFGQESGLSGARIGS